MNPHIHFFALLATTMTSTIRIELPTPDGPTLKASRLAAGLSQVEAAEMMGYPVQPGSRGGLQSRTWQALESATDGRNMPAPVYALFLMLTHQHPVYALKPSDVEAQSSRQ